MRCNQLTRAPICSACAIAIAIMPVPAKAESLGDAITAALQTSAPLAAQRAQLAATHEDISIAHAGYFPRLTLSGTATASNNPALPGAATGITLGQSSYGYSANLEQPVFDGFRTDSAVAEATYNEQAATQDERAATQAAIQDAVTAYLDVVRDRTNLQLRRKTVQMLLADLAAISERLAHGDASRTDVDQTAARLATARVNEAAAEAGLDTSQASFEQAIGHPPEALAAPPVPEALLPHSRLAARAAAAKDNPDLLAARYRERAAKQSVHKVEADLLPQVSLRASYSHNYGNLAAGTDYEDARAMAEVVLPVSLGGETIFKLRRARLVVRQRAAETQNRQAQIRTRIDASWAALEAARRQLEANAQAGLASERALQGVRKQRRNGDKTTLDVLNAEQDLIEARLRTAQVRHDMIAAAYALLAGTGALAPSAH